MFFLSLRLTNINIMTRILSFLIMGLVLLSSCEDKIDKRDMYTFTGQTAMDYINSNPNLSSFAKILTISRNGRRSNSSTVATLLGTRGEYTVYAPNNEAIKLYLDSIYGSTDYMLDTMSQEVADRIVLVSIMDFALREKAWREANLHEGALEPGTLDDQHLIVKYGDWGEGAYIKLNNAARLIKADIEVDNGYVNIIDRVLPPPPSSLYGLIQQTPNLRIFSMLLELTSWGDSIIRYEDKVYNDSIYFAKGYDRYSKSVIPIPRYRLYGYTAFVEPDEVFQKDWGIPQIEIDTSTNAISNRDEILSVINARCREAYPDAADNDYTSMGNAVNQFVSYHLFEGKYLYKMLAGSRSEFGFKWPDLKPDPGFEESAKDPYLPTDTWDYFRTMGKPNRLIKVTRLWQTEQRFINRHSYYNNAFNGDYQETSCDHEGTEVCKDNGTYDNFCLNGYYYPVSHVLLYDDYVRHAVLNERIRYNLVYDEPNIMNILRMDCPRFYWYGYTTDPITNEKFNRTIEPSYFIPPEYCKNISFKKDRIRVTSGESARFYKALGSFIRENDITFKLYPVPYAGNWEIRIANIRDGLVNYYMGNSMKGKMEKIGPPHDLRMDKRRILLHKYIDLPHTTIRLTERFQREDSLFHMEGDHVARLHDMMLGPFGIMGRSRSDPSLTYSSFIARVYLQLCRIIVYRGYMTPDKDYYIRLQNLNDKAKESQYDHAWCRFHLIELVPESVYANPNRQEDWW